MKVLVVYIMLFVLCINIFGASLGQFIHQLSHLFEFKKGHLAMIEYADIDTHFHYTFTTQHINHPTDTNNYHEHNQIIDFMLTAFSLQNTNTALPDFTFISLFMLIIDGIINNMNILLFNSTVEHLGSKLVISISLYKSIFLKTPSPPPKVLT